jgi:hypothetical protein
VELVAVTQALAASELLDCDDASYGDLRELLAAAMIDLVKADARDAVRDDAMLALAALDPTKATTLCYTVFAGSSALSGGPAGRLLERLTGSAEPPAGALLASLSTADNLRAVLTSRTLAERGAAMVPALRTALSALPVPAVPDSPGWWDGEIVKFRIMCALQWLGPVAAPAVPLLIALLEDQQGYRDTRHQAKVTLQAIGRPAAEALVVRLRQCLLRAHPVDSRHDVDSADAEAFIEAVYIVGQTLSGMPPAAMPGLPGLDEVLAMLRSRPEQIMHHLADMIRDEDATT